ncbi:MAG: hypothetical protein ACM3TU_03915 [Bacillota bacterium]
MLDSTQKTYDAHTAHFLGVVAQNIPPLPRGIMQHWIEHPSRLQQMLALALYCDPNDDMWTSVGKGKEPAGRDVGVVPLPLKTMRCPGQNPFAAWKTEAHLQFGVEYNHLPDRKRYELVLRPYLDLEFDESGKYIQIPARDVFRGGQRLEIKLPDILPLLERTTRGLSSLLAAGETAYADQVVTFVRDDLETRLTCEERRDGWEITLTLLKEGASYYSTTFWLSGVSFRKRLQDNDMKVPAYVEMHII